jgi:hypothetical protein
MLYGIKSVKQGKGVYVPDKPKTALTTFPALNDASASNLL